MDKKLEEIKLSAWAKENKIPYKKAWEMHKSNTLPVKTKISNTNRVYVLRESIASELNGANDGKFAMPSSVPFTHEIKASSTRRNKAATSQPTDEFFHIASGVSPYQIGNRNRTNEVDVSKAIRLCQLCYWNFSIFRNTIDVMTEFSTSDIYLRGGSKKAQDFFYNWFQSIKMPSFQDKFFREAYRSSNNIIYRMDAELKQDDIKQLNKAFGIQIEAKKTVKLPFKYIILNPADINVMGNVLFSSGNYYKILNSYELSRLRDPQTKEEQQLYDGLSPEIQKQVKIGAVEVQIPLDPELIYAIFCKKQDYEPLAIPMAYPVLKDINWKAEMKHIDMAVSRTMQQVVLLVKMGYESKDGTYMFDTRAAEGMRQLFESESVGKVLVADFTTDIKWAIPTIGDFLDPKKYEIVNADIKEGLNAILTGGDSKFANQYIQVQLFVQRLEQTRDMFIDEFLFPEMKRIGEIMGFKGNIPKPYFEEIDLKDSEEFNRIITRLTEIGVLTATEALNAIETGRIPTKDESIEAQEEYKKLRDKGYYEPITGGPKTQMDMQTNQLTQQSKMQDKQFEHDAKEKIKDRKHAAENPAAPSPQIHINTPTKLKQPAGKPAGKNESKMKQRKSAPMKAGLDLENDDLQESYSLTKIKDNMILLADLNKGVQSYMLSKNNLKQLNEEQMEMSNQICDIIIANVEDSKDWISNINKYVDNPINDNDERLQRIDEIAIEHNISPFLASILLASTRSE